MGFGVLELRFAWEIHRGDRLERRKVVEAGDGQLLSLRERDVRLHAAVDETEHLGVLCGVNCCA